jgi:hypothetical protein
MGAKFSEMRVLEVLGEARGVGSGAPSNVQAFLRVKNWRNMHRVEEITITS